MFKIWFIFQKWNKILTKIFSFLCNYIWNQSRKFSQFRRAYLSSTINVSTDTSQISQITKRDILKISFSQSDQKIWQKGSREDFTSVWNPLTSWLSKGILKQRFLESDLTKFFTVCKFGNMLAMTIIVLNLIWIPEFEPKIKDNFLVFWIIALELGAANSHNTKDIFYIYIYIFSLAVSELTNSPKVSHITKTNIFKIVLPQSNEKKCWKCSHQHFTSVSNPLTR